MSKCDKCGNTHRNYGMITIANREGHSSETICNSCYNKEMAENIGIEDFTEFEPILILQDCDREEHKFEIRKMIHGTAVFWEAVEFLDNDEIGYSFQIYQDFEDDSLDAVARLKKKVKDGLSKKYIKKSVVLGRESLSFNEDNIEGKIEWDDDYDGRIPKFKIDGKEYSAEQIGKILMGYEGWDFELRIKESTD